MKKIVLFLTLLQSLTVLMSQDISEAYYESYVVIAESSTDYDFLYHKMEALSKITNIEIDLMERVYNSEEKIIALPEDDKDEIYAGSYYPRRYGGNSLSIENLSYYTGKPLKGDETMIIVAGILEEEQAAELLEKILPHAANAYILNAMIYMGCMH